MLLEADTLVKKYRSGDRTVVAVDSVSLSLDIGELALLMGPSGSGKTTLLSILGCILEPDSGSLRLSGEEVLWLESELPFYRRRYFGFVYQSFNLLEALNVRENVAVPLWLTGCRGGVAEEIAEHALGSVGMMHRSQYATGLLSGGERQRVAIARAMAADAPILLADEPTGNLDSHNGMQVMTTLRTLAREQGKAVLVVTHDLRYVHLADHVFQMEDGTVRSV